MTFDKAVDKIMPEVVSGSKEPFIIYRDAAGDWHSDFTQNQYGEEFSWVGDTKENDPFAVTFTGADFSNGSYSYVFDKVLCARLRAEYDFCSDNNTYDDKHNAMLNFFEDNIGEFSQETLDYILRYDRPLDAITDMIPFTLESNTPNLTYNENLTMDALGFLESKINTLINRKEDKIEDIPPKYDIEETPKKREIEGYTEMISIELAGRVVVLAENPEVINSYLVCNIKWDNPIGLEERYDGAVTDNYVEAMREFFKRVDVLAQSLEAERDTSGLSFHTLTADDCIKGGLESDLEGKAIIIKPEILAREYRSAEYQLVLCTGGFGSRPNARGRAVFTTELFSGKQSRYEKQHIAGVIDPAKMPEWAVNKLSEYTRVEDKRVSKTPIEVKANKNPNLIEKLEIAKKEAEKKVAKSKSKAVKKRKETEER